MPGELNIWLARDSDGHLAMYQSEPSYNDSLGEWEPTGDDPIIRLVELGVMSWPEIDPACCVRFEQKNHYRETFVFQ